MNDFVAETRGHCFLCSNKISSQPPSSIRLDSGLISSTHSLYDLSRYLGMDMKKAFTGSGPIPPDLVARLEKSKLRAELCEECASLSKSFSELFRRLEKVEMEVASCLDLIRGKLEKAVDLCKTNDRYDDNLVASSSNLDYEWIAKLEITEALRKHAMQKCSRKLRASRRPIAKLQRLTWKQMNAEKLKINSGKGVFNPQSLDQDSASNYEHKALNSPASLPMASDNECDYQNDQNQYSFGAHSQSESDVFQVEAVKMEVIWGSQQYEQPEVFNPNLEVQDLEQRQRCSEAGKLSQAIPPPIKVILEQPPNSLNLETGAYKCQICSLEYTTESTFQLHFKTAHLKERYKCGLCEKKFTLKPIMNAIISISTWGQV